MASKRYLQLLEQFKNRPASTHLSIEKIREGFEKLLAAYPAEADIRFESSSINSIPACWVFGPEVSRKKVILFFHGGGFNAGSVNSHRDLMGRISKACGLPLLAIGYRLAPEHPFPAALEDALKAYQWLLDRSYSSSDIALLSGALPGAA
jgi:acetyl esterase/lipase